MSIRIGDYLNKLGKKINFKFSDDVLPNAGVFEMSVERRGTVVASQIEEGSFTSYNKTVEPIQIDATLAYRGKDSVLQSVLKGLHQLQESVTKFSIITPSYEYENMTLQNFSYSLRREDGYGALYVDCTFVEIKEVKIAYTTGSPITQESTGDDSAVSSVDGGTAQGEEISNSSSSGSSSGTAAKRESGAHMIGRIASGNWS